VTPPLAALLPLVALAGCVDGIGFLRLSELFVSFMSGTSTMFGVALASADLPRAAVLGSVLALFAAGALAGGLLARILGPRWQSAVVLGVVAALLGIAWQAPGGAGPARPISAEAYAMVPAMGALNAALPGVTGLTFVTGALTRFADGLAAALRGDGSHRAWLAHLASWAALVMGGVAGALLELHWPGDALALPSLGAAAGATLALVLALRRPG
jgi:uncharacterized membrane protein YoaK (UPF0700 family)